MCYYTLLQLHGIYEFSLFRLVHKYLPLGLLMRHDNNNSVECSLLALIICTTYWNESPLFLARFSYLFSTSLEACGVYSFFQTIIIIFITGIGPESSKAHYEKNVCSCDENDHTITVQQKCSTLCDSKLILCYCPSIYINHCFEVTIRHAHILQKSRQHD